MYIYKVCGMRLTCAAEQEVPYAAVKYFQEVMGRIEGDFTETYKAVMAESYEVAAKEISHNIVEYLAGGLGSNGKIKAKHVEFELARLELNTTGFWLDNWSTNCKTYNVGDCLHGDSK